MKKVLFAFAVVLMIAFFAKSQGLVISRYIPGDYLSNNIHRIDIYNPAAQARDLSGFILVTRNYSIKLPTGTIIRPKSAYTLARYSAPNQRVDLILSRCSDFLIRFPDPEIRGNYVSLFDRRLNLVDGMYFSPSNNVDFLPDAGLSITAKGDTVLFRIPGENESFWKNRAVFLEEDPAIGFIQAQNNWIPTGIRLNLFPAAGFNRPQASWFEGIIKIEFQSLFEENCVRHFIERSLDGLQFSSVGEVNAKGRTVQKTNYEFYDPSTKKGEKYHYRIRNTDIFGYDIYSDPIMVLADESPGDFYIDIFKGTGLDLSAFSIRFRSVKDQMVTLRLLRKDFKDEGLLFSGQIHADRQNLVLLQRNLQPGQYLLIAETAERRYFREIEVE